ncbi:hypothetical protein [Flavobacterium ichthyis]|nr:hypothetical protein [Flavobacterium ichthyis]
MKYTESQLEKSFIYLLKEEGYEYVNGRDLFGEKAKDFSPQR